MDDKFQFTSNENPIVYTSDLIVINSHDESQCNWKGAGVGGREGKKNKLCQCSARIVGKKGSAQYKAKRKKRLTPEKSTMQYSTTKQKLCDGMDFNIRSLHHRTHSPSSPRTINSKHRSSLAFGIMGWGRCVGALNFAHTIRNQYYTNAIVTNLKPQKSPAQPNQTEPTHTHTAAQFSTRTFNILRTKFTVCIRKTIGCCSQQRFKCCVREYGYECMCLYIVIPFLSFPFHSILIIYVQ